NWIGGCFFLAAALFVIYLVSGSEEAFVVMMYFGFLLFPLAVTFQLPSGKPRMLGAAYTAAVALMGATSLGPIFLGSRFPLPEGMNPVSLFTLFVWGAVLSTWIGGFLSRSAFAR